MFALLAFKGGGQGAVAADDGLELAGLQHQRVFAVGFLKKHLALLVDKGQAHTALPAAYVHFCGDFSVAQDGMLLVRLDEFHILAGHGIQQGEAVVPHLAHEYGAHTKAVRAPGLHHHGFTMIAPDDLLTVPVKILHVVSPLRLLDDAGACRRNDSFALRTV